MILLNQFYLKKTTTAGFEPAQAMPNGFQVRLLNHSDMLPIIKRQLQDSNLRMHSIMA